MTLGRQEFETIVASAAKKKLVNFSATNSAPLAAGGVEYIRFYAPPNTIVTFLGLVYTAPVPIGATSGDHTIVVGYELPSVDMVTAKHAFGVPIQFQNGMFSNATLSKSPDTTEGLISNLNNLAFDNVLSLRIVYTNNTNVTQTGSRVAGLWGIAETIG